VKSYFYALVSKDTVEEEFSHKRQLFLLEQATSTPSSIIRTSTAKDAPTISAKKV
jgi:hypothetical protein